MITLAEKKIKIKCTQLDGYFVRWYHNGWHHWFFYAGDETFETKGEWHNTESQTKVKMGYSGLTYNQVRSIRTAYRDWETDRKSTRLNSSHEIPSRMPSSA